MAQVLVLYRVAFGQYLGNHLLHVHRVPHDNGIGEWIQTAYDFLLSILLLTT